MMKFMELSPKKGWELEMLDGTQMNRYNTYCVVFEYSGLTSSL